MDVHSTSEDQINEPPQMANLLKPILAGTSPSFTSFSSVSKFVCSFPHFDPKIIPYKLFSGHNNCVKINNINRNRTNRRLLLGFGVSCSWSQFLNMFGIQKENSFLAFARQKSAVEEVRFLLLRILIVGLLIFVFLFSGFLLFWQFMVI